MDGLPQQLIRHRMAVIVGDAFEQLADGKSMTGGEFRKDVDRGIDLADFDASVVGALQSDHIGERKLTKTGTLAELTQALGKVPAKQRRLIRA